MEDSFRLGITHIGRAQVERTRRIEPVQVRGIRRRAAPRREAPRVAGASRDAPSAATDARA
jgi:hypothetical protein